MGITYISKPGIKGYIMDNETGQLEIMNGIRAQAAVRLKGDQFVEVAKGVFEAHSKHESTPPVEYLEHFGVREHHFGAVLGIQVYNDDRTAEWVEFGAHAGGKTRVLRYRVFGRTEDIMGARAKL